MKLTILEYNKEYSKIAFTGDIHGEFRTLVNAIEIRPELHQTLLVVWGDIGLGFNKLGYYLDTVKWMEQRL